MTAVQAFAPDTETLEYGAVQLPERRWTPGAVGCVDGPGNLGPEHAGALSLVFGSFSDAEKAQRTYRRFTDAQCAVRDAPGFMRWFSFVDGPHGYGLGWWRSAADAEAFARGPLHRELVREQRAEGLEYSQFAGIWTAHAVGRRNYYCPSCSAVTAAPGTFCTGCGTPLHDGFGSSG
jgi:heme-degrading monooxygenase HmoA